MAPPVLCFFCDKPCHGVIYEHMSGWSKRRGSVGGLNGLRLRRPAPLGHLSDSGETVVTVQRPHACSTCIALLEDGGNPRTQEKLFDA